MIRDWGRGLLVYEQQEGRRIGLMAKLPAYELQDAGLTRSKPTTPVDSRPITATSRYRAGFSRLGVTKVRLLVRRCLEKVRRLSAPGLRWWSACPAKSRRARTRNL